MGRGLVVLAGIACLGALLGLAQVGGAQSTRTPSFARPEAPAALQKLDSRLRAVAVSRADDGLTAARATARAQEIEPTSRGVIVIVEPSAGVGAAEDAIQAAGGTVDSTADRLIQARITTDRLAAVARSSAVREV